MTRLPARYTESKTRTLPSVWVKVHLSESEDKYLLSIVGPAPRAIKRQEGQAKTCAYAKLILMGSGAIMATFPVTSMVSGTIKQFGTAQWFELAAPLTLPAFVFGQDIEIAEGKHPLTFALENWVVMFRPQQCEGHN